MISAPLPMIRPQGQSRQLAPMILLVLTLSLLILLSAPASAASPDSGFTPAPELQLSTDTWNFGERWKGEVVETKITITNAGNAPLEIERIKTSCGCTVADLETRTLPPGASEEIEITYDTNTRMKKVRQRVMLFTNDPDESMKIITIDGTIKDAVVLSDPLGIDLGRIGSTGTAGRTLDLTCQYERPLKLKLGKVVGQAAEQVDIRLEEVQPGKEYKLHARTVPPLPFGTVYLKVQLKTDADRIPELEIPVRGHVQPPVMVVPNRVFVPGSASMRTERMVRLLSWRDRPVEVTELRSSDPDLTAEVMPLAPGVKKKDRQASAITIRISVPPADDLPDTGAKLTIVTNDPEYGEFTVDVVKQQADRRAP